MIGSNVKLIGSDQMLSYPYISLATHPNSDDFSTIFVLSRRPGGAGAWIGVQGAVDEVDGVRPILEEIEEAICPECLNYTDFILFIALVIIAVSIYFKFGKPKKPMGNIVNGHRKSY